MKIAPLQIFTTNNNNNNREEMAGQNSNNDDNSGGPKGLYGSRTGQNMFLASLAELIGTFILVFAGTSVAVSATLGQTIAGAPNNSLAVSLAFGLILTSLVYTLGHISGAHLNPAVTLGLTVTGNFPWKFLPAYVVSQLIGAILASLLVWGLYGADAKNIAGLGATQPADGISGGRVFVMEAFVTGIFVLVVLSVATDGRAHPAVAGIAVGYALAICVMVAGPITGGSVNPVRSLGPIFVGEQWAVVWAYVVGPLLGGVIGAVIYDRVLAKANKPDDNTPGRGNNV